MNYFNSSSLTITPGHIFLGGQVTDCAWVEAVLEGAGDLTEKDRCGPVEEGRPLGALAVRNTGVLRFAQNDASDFLIQ
jgi:hypothetical protein